MRVSRIACFMNDAARLFLSCLVKFNSLKFRESKDSLLGEDGVVFGEIDRNPERVATEDNFI